MRVPTSVPPPWLDDEMEDWQEYHSVKKMIQEVLDVKRIIRLLRRMAK